jgi:hypothetical protein
MKRNKYTEQQIAFRLKQRSWVLRLKKSAESWTSAMQRSIYMDCLPMQAEFADLASLVSRDRLRTYIRCQGNFRRPNENPRTGLNNWNGPLFSQGSPCA